MLEEMTREIFADLVRGFLHLPADAVISADHLDAVRNRLCFR